MKAHKRPTQCERILQYLKDFGEISSAEAITELCCYRLGARIWELKSKGYPIKRHMLTGKNRYGENVSWAVYSLEK